MKFSKKLKSLNKTLTKMTKTMKAFDKSSFG